MRSLPNEGKRKIDGQIEEEHYEKIQSLVHELFMYMAIRNRRLALDAEPALGVWPSGNVWPQGFDIPHGDGYWAWCYNEPPVHWAFMLTPQMMWEFLGVYYQPVRDNSGWIREGRVWRLTSEAFLESPGRDRGEETSQYGFRPRGCRHSSNSFNRRVEGCVTRAGLTSH